MTFYIHAEHPERFVLRSVRPPFAASDLRSTVDTHEDLAFVRRVYEDLGLAENHLGAGEVIAWLREHPDIAAINASVVQKAF